MESNYWKGMVMAVCLQLLALFLAGQARQTIPAGMVKIPAGHYTPFLKNKTEIKREVEAFYLDVYAVTNADFLRFVKANPRWARSKVSRLYADANYLSHWKGDLDVDGKSGALMSSPVTNISWFAARAYAKWAGKRLPTLDEWEYAARAPIAGTRTPVEKVILQWYSKPNPAVIPAVGSTFINSFKIHDMHGLIWEWVDDFNSVMMDNDSRSSNLNSNLYCAAGSFSASDKKDYAAFMRYAFRGSLKASYTISNLGFRCAGDIK